MFYQSQPELNIFAIFLRLGLFTRSYRWNAFKDNKEIRIAFRNPYQGEREAFKVNKAVQLSTISHFPLPVSQLWIWLMLNFLDVHIKIFRCIHKDSFSCLFFPPRAQLWKQNMAKKRKPYRMITTSKNIYCRKVRDSTRAGASFLNESWNYE